MPFILTTSLLLSVVVVALIVISALTVMIVRFKQINKKLIVKFTQKTSEFKSSRSPVYEEVASIKSISPPGSPSTVGTEKNVAYEQVRPI